MNNERIRYLITYLTEWQERAIRKPVAYTLTILEHMKRKELIRVMSVSELEIVSEREGENKERVSEREGENKESESENERDRVRVNESENERVIDFIMDATSLHHSFTNRFINRKK